MNKVTHPHAKSWIDGLPCAVRVVCQIYNFRHELLTGEDAECIAEANRFQLEFPLDQVVASGTIVVILCLMLFIVLGA